MHFKHPELLYALFLLLIPIFIHLFQLRRFKKVEFTNVKFLKKVKLQTRKSAQLKKWLILFTRLLLLTCVIIAFAQPFIPNTKHFNKKTETVIYIDNSFSMQAKGQNGSLLNGVIQDIISKISDTKNISVFTNDNIYKDIDVSTLKNKLIGLSYSKQQLSYDAALLKGKQLFSKNTANVKHLVMASDFQQKATVLNFENDSIHQLHLIQPKPVSISNVSIDSIYISKALSETLDINVVLQNNGEAKTNVGIALYNNDVLISKSAVDITDKAETTFTLPNNTNIKGKLVVEDSGLKYDDVFYFNTDKKQKINVLALTESASTSFLKRIYTEDEFNFKTSEIKNLNFNNINEQNLIVLNELNSISNALKNALNLYVKDGGALVIIPSTKVNLESYNTLFKVLNTPNYTNTLQVEKRITTINYSHPVLANTFNSKVKNFQYPKTNSYYTLSSKNNAVLSFEDNNPFLIGKEKVFTFTSALNVNNSNFKSTPLIVPVLYNIGLQSLKLPKLYYTIGEANTISINASLKSDDILTLTNANSSNIPLQKTFSKSVAIETSDYPELSGVYAVKNKKDTLQNISFNYNRKESNLKYYDLNALNIETDNSMLSTFQSIKSSTDVNALWKWFAIFATVFLIIEMLILKYLK